MPQPLVSIIIPTYNRAALVCRAVESALAQTYPNIEVLVVNNGSTDNTAEVLQKYATHPRVRLITIPQNGRVYKAYNTAMPLVRGKYATFLYDDDTFLPEAMELLVAKAEELGAEVGLIFGNCLDPDVGVLTGAGIEQERYVTYEDAMSGNIRGEYSGIWRMEVFGTRQFEEDLVGGESLVWHDIYRVSKGYYIARPVRHYYRYREDSISKLRFDPVHLQRVAKTSARHIEKFGADMKRICPPNYVYHLRNAAVWHVLAGQRRAAFNYLREALNYAPAWRIAPFFLTLILPRFALKWILTLRHDLRRRAQTQGAPTRA